MAEETTRVVEPEEIQLTTDTPVSTSTVADAPAQQVPLQTGDDELDGDMDAIERAIDDPSAASGEDIGGLGMVHTGSRRDLDPTNATLPIEARPTEEGEINRDPAEAPGVTEAPRGDQAEQALPSQNAPQDEAAPQQGPSVRRDETVTEVEVSGAEATDIIQPAGTDGLGSLVQQAAATAPAQTVQAPVEQAPVDLPPAVAPGLSVGPQTTLEDTGFALDLTALASTGTGTLSVLISGLPPGTVLNRGSQSGDNWILTASDLAGLIITPPPNYSGSVTMRIDATTTGEGGDTATASYSVPVTVTPVADQPPVSISPAASVDEDTAVPLNIDSRLIDTDGSEVLSVRLAGVPSGATLSAGSKNADGSWSLTADQLAGLTMTPPKNYSGTINLTVTSTSTETANGDSKSSVATASIVINPVADAADVTVKAATGKEDSTISLDVSAALTDTDGSEVMSVVISNVPSGAILSQNGKALTANADGTYSLTPGQLAGLTVKPPVNSDDDFTLKVSVTTSETANGNSKTVDVDLPVTVTPVADAPTLTGPTAGIAGTEDTTVTLNIASALTDSTNESLSIKIEGVPGNATLKSGATVLSANQDGSYTLTPEQLKGLTLTPGENDRTAVTLKVTATSTEANPAATASEQQASTVIDIPVTFKSVVDGGSLTMTPATGKEDSAISLSITPVLKDASETVDSITISNIPAGTAFNVGQAGANGTWIVSKADISSLTVTPPANSDDDFTLKVAVTVKDTDGNTVTSTPQDLPVTVTPVADAPTLTGPTAGIAGTEDTTVTLNIASALTDSTNESLSIKIEGVPGNATLKSGATVLSANQDGSYTLTPEQLKGLTLTPGENDRTAVTLKVTATSTEANPAATASEQQASTVIDIPVTFKSVVDGGSLTMTPAIGNEDTSISLSITPVLKDASETVDSITISNVPNGVTLNQGTLNPDGTYTLTPAQLSGLKVTPPANSDVDFTLKVSVTVKDPEGNVATSTPQDLAVTVRPTADAPVASVAQAVVSTDEDVAVGLGLSAVKTDTDGSEDLTVEISGIPAGGKILDAAGNTLGVSNGTLTLTEAQIKAAGGLEALKFQAPDNASGEWTLSVKATSTEKDSSFGVVSASDTTQVTVKVAPVVDANPQNFTLTSVGTKEDTDVALGIAVPGTLGADTDGSESVTKVTISGLDGDAKLVTSSGTVLTPNADGTYELTPSDLSGLKYRPAPDSDVDDVLSVTFSVKDQTADGSQVATSEITQSMTVRIDAVAMKPTIVLDDVASGTLASGTGSTPVGANRNMVEGSGDYHVNLTAATGDANDTSESIQYIQVAVTNSNGKSNGTSLAEVGYYDNGVFKSITALGLGSDSAVAVSGGSAVTWYNVPVDKAQDLVVRAKDYSDSDFRLYSRAKAVDAPTDGGGTGSGGVENTSDNTAYSNSVYLSFDGKGVANGLTLTAQTPGAGVEDSGQKVALGLKAALIDTDGSETISGTLSGLPAGTQVYNGGTLLGTVQAGTGFAVSGLSQSAFNGLTVVTPDNYAGQISLSAEIWTVERDPSSTATKTSPHQTVSQTITVTPVADGISETANSVTVAEDAVISYPVTFSLKDTDDTGSGAGHEAVTDIVIKSSDPDMAGSKWWAKVDGVETELTVTANGDGTYSITVPKGAIVPKSGTTDTADAYTIDGLKVQPAKDSDGDISVQFHVTTTDTATGSAPVSTVNVVNGTVTVTAVTDDITMTAADVSGKEDANGNQFPLSLTVGLQDTDGSEVVQSVILSGVPSGWEIVGATKQADGTWKVTDLSSLKSVNNNSPTLSGLFVKLPEHESTATDVALKMTVTWQDMANPTEASARTQSVDFKVNIDPVADMPVAVVKSVTGLEDTPLDVYINPSLIDKDGSEVLSVTISQLPSGAKFGHVVNGVFVELTSADNGNGTWTFNASQLSGLKILPPQDSNQDFTMKVTVRSTEQHDNADGDNIAEFTQDVKVDIIGVADGTVLKDGEAILRSGKEDQALDLDLDSVALADSDAAAGRPVSETASYVIDVKSLPAGFTLSGVPEDAMIPLGNGRWSIDPDYIGQLKLNPPKDFANDYSGGTKLSMTLEVRSTENDGDVRVETHPINITIEATPDAPTVANPAAGKEDSVLTIPLTVGAGDSDGSETVTAMALTSKLSGFTVTTNTGAQLVWDPVDGRYEVNGDGDLRGYSTLTLTPDASRTDLGGSAAKVDYTLKVSVRDANGSTADFNVNKSIAVAPKADTPIVGAANTAVAVVGDPAPLTLKALSGEAGQTVNGVTTPDGSEKISLVVSNMVNGAVLVHKNAATGAWELVGHNNGDGSWTVDSSTLDAFRDASGALPSGAIQVWAPWGQRDGSGNYSPLTSLGLTVKVIATEQEGSGADRIASASESLTITWGNGGSGGGDGGGGDGGGGGTTPAWGSNASLSGVEDHAVSNLGLTAPGGVSYVIVTGVPNGGSLSSGVSLGNGAWKVASGDLGSLTFTPPEDVGGKLPMTPGGGPITLTVKGYDSGDTQVGSAFDRVITLRPEADAPTVSVQLGYAYEDEGIALSKVVNGVAVNKIAVASTDNDGSETVSVLIKVPKGFILSGGIDPEGTAAVAGGDGQPSFVLNGSGAAEYNVYSVSASQLSSLSIVRDTTVPSAENYSGPLKIYVTGVATELEGGQAVTEVPYVINIVEKADGATLTAAPASGVEDHGAIALNLNAGLIDSGESITKIWISGHDSSKMSFVDASGNAVTDVSNLTVAQLQALKAVPVANYSGTLTFTVNATTKDGSDTLTTSKAVSVTVSPETDMPVITVTPTETGKAYQFHGAEDSAIKLDVAAALTDTDGSELMSVTVQIPVGAVLLNGSGGVVGGNTGNGTWILRPEDLNNLYVVPPRNFNGDMTVKVNATAWEKGHYEDAKTATSSIIVKVDPVADRPDIEPPSTLVISEDTAQPLNLNIAYGASNEQLTLTITDVPGGAGFTLNGVAVGTLAADGKTWTFNNTQVQQIIAAGTDAFKVVPPNNSNADFTLKVKVDSYDNGSTATSAGVGADGYRPITVTMNAVADAPTQAVAANVSGNEDSAIALNISSSLTDTDGSETLSVIISGVPAGGNLSHGTLNADGTWTVQSADLAALKFTPPVNASGTFTLTATAVATETVNKDTASAPGTTFTVTVAPVADTPSLVLGSVATRDEDANGNVVPLSISATSPDSSETVSVTISGLPTGATLSAGTLNPDGSYTVPAASLPGLTLTLPAHYSGTTTLSVVATSADGASTASTTGTISFTTTGVADAAQVTPVAASGAEDTGIALDLGVVMVDNDGSETLSVALGNIPSGATLTANGVPVTVTGGVATLSAAQLSGLVLTPPANYAGTLTLSVTATTTEGATSATTTTTLPVTVTAVADTPTLTAGNVSGNEDTAIPLNLTAALTDTDGSETLVLRITGVPSDGVLSAGTRNADGSWTVPSANVAGLTFKAGENVSGSFTLGVQAISTETSNGATASTTVKNFGVTVNPVADAPDAKGAQISTNSGTGVALNLAVVHTDPSETLTLTIEGVPAGASLTHATNLGGGVWSVQEADLGKVTFTAPNGGADGHWTMTLKAVSTESNGTSASDSVAVDVTVDHTATAVTIKVIDPYVQGAMVFYDTDGDGVRDDTEVMGYTNEFGEVTLNIDSSVSGRFISIGGIDSATGKPVDGVFIGTGSTLTPLTTVLDSIGSQHGQSAAEWLVDKLGMDPQTLQGIDLQNFDPVATLVGDGAQSAQAGEILRAGMMVQNTVSMLTSVIEGSHPGISNADAAKIALQQVVAAVDEDGLSALTTGAGDLVQNALSAAGSGVTLPADVIEDMAQAIAANNTALQSQTGDTGQELLANLSAVSTEAQGSVADQLHQVADAATPDQPVGADSAAQQDAAAQGDQPQSGPDTWDTFLSSEHGATGQSGLDGQDASAIDAYNSLALSEHGTGSVNDSVSVDGTDATHIAASDAGSADMAGLDVNHGSAGDITTPATDDHTHATVASMSLAS